MDAMTPSRIAIAMAVVAAILVGASCSAKAQGISQQQAEEMLKELRAIRQALERISAPPSDQAADQRVRLKDAGGLALGRPDAPLTLVEFTDLQCQFCNRFQTTAYQQIKSEYIDSGKVRFVTRDFPLDFHPYAMQAARASRCAGEQGRFWEMRQALTLGYNRLGPAFVTATAQSLALDMTAFDACAASTRHDAAIAKDIEDARSINIEGTPSFVLGRTAPDGLDGVLIVGALPFSAFDAKIKAMLAETR